MSMLFISHVISYSGRALALAYPIQCNHFSCKCNGRLCSHGVDGRHHFVDTHFVTSNLYTTSLSHLHIPKTEHDIDVG